MPRDFTPFVIEAKRRAGAWSREVFTRTLHDVAARFPESDIDWDSGVPEGWGLVAAGRPRATVAMVRRDCPLAVLRSPIAASEEGTLNGAGIVTFTAYCDDEVITLDPRVAREMEPRWSYPDPPEGYEGEPLTVKDIYVATI